MTALLNSEIGHSVIGKEEEESKIVTYIQEAENMGIKILPPDIQASQTRFSIEGSAIRFGLLSIKNVGEGAVESLVEARNKKGLFKNWDDFIDRIDVHAANRKVLESLIKAGACDCFGSDHLMTRADLTAQLDISLDWAGSQKLDLSAGQGQLFGIEELKSGRDNKIKVEPWSEHTALAFEKEVLGFYLSGHPLAQHKFDLIAFSQYRLDKLPPAPADPRHAPMVRIVGMITNCKKLITKEKKDPYARFKLEDLHGEIEVVVFPKSYASLARHIVTNNIVVVKGRLSGRETENELLAEEIMTLEEGKRILPSYVKSVRLKITSAGLDDETLDKIKTVIRQHPGDVPVVLDIAIPAQGDYTIETSMNVKYEKKFFQEIEKILGPESWNLRAV
jgi:DNA polymerase-3 subunit alpha